MAEVTPDPSDLERLQWNYEAARRIIHGLLVAIDGGLSSDLRREADNARSFMRSTSAKAVHRFPEKEQ